MFVDRLLLKYLIYFNNVLTMGKSLNNFTMRHFLVSNVIFVRSYALYMQLVKPTHREEYVDIFI